MDNNINRVLPTHIIACAGAVLNEKEEILLVKTHRHGWSLPGGIVEEGENIINGVKREVMEETGVDIEVGRVFCISSNTCKYPGYNGVKEVPTKIMLDFICRAKSGTPRPSEENPESAYFPVNKAFDMIEDPGMKERFKAFLAYNGSPIYLEYANRPDFQLKLKTII